MPHATPGSSGDRTAGTELAAAAQRLLAAALASDPAGIRAEMDAATTTFGLGDCLDDVLFPAFRELGAQWHDGLVAIAQERWATEAVRGWLDAQLTAAPGPEPGLAGILLSGGPHDRHTLGLECLMLLLRQRGRSSRSLGGRVSVTAVTAAARAAQPCCVVIVSQLADGRRQVLPSLHALTELDIPVFYGGNAFGTAAARAGVPGEYVGDRLQDACGLLDTMGR